MRLLAVTALVLACGCATSADLTDRKELMSHPQWPTIRSAVRDEVIRREGAQNWDTTAGFFPIARKGTTWVVHASADYPLNRHGHMIDIEVEEDGKILRYDRRWEKQK